MPKAESVVQSEARVLLGKLGVLHWRNNVGACSDETGRIIRYGLGNDSAQVSKHMKSSDLIGIYQRPSLAYRDNMGAFLALECKHEGWYLTPGDERGQAQLMFINLVRARGGRAGFVTCDDDVHAILRGEERLGAKP